MSSDGLLPCNFEYRVIKIMSKISIMLILLLHSLMVQAAPNNAVTLKQNMNWPA